jgi:hypothetical protein
MREEMKVEKLILLVKDHESFYDALHCEHQNCDQLASICMKIAQEMAVGKWSTLVFCFLL